MFKDISRSLLAAFLITIYWMVSACSVKVVHYWVGKSAKTKRSIFLSSTPRIVHYAAAFTPILLTAFLLSPLAVSCQVIKTQKTVEVEQIEWIDEVVLRQHFAFLFVILVALVQQVWLHSRWSHRLPLAPYAYRYYRLMLYSHSTHHRHILTQRATASGASTSSKTSLGTYCIEEHSADPRVPTRASVDRRRTWRLRTSSEKLSATTASLLGRSFLCLTSTGQPSDIVKQLEDSYLSAVSSSFILMPWFGKDLQCRIAWIL